LSLSFYRIADLEECSVAESIRVGSLDDVDIIFGMKGKVAIITASSTGIGKGIA
jgi:hypothetical protein